MDESRPRLFNTLTRQLEPIEPLFPEKLVNGRPVVGMYCCGPTVYDFGHIGNFRTFVLADLIRRYLEFRGLSVNHVMNITDVEDKIIRCVRESGKSLREFTRHFEGEFFKDLQTLNCLPPTQTPRATEHMPEIIGLIQRLEERSLAYRTPDGSVYFSIQKYQGCGCRYGQLVNLNFEAMRVGDRVASDEYEKESVADFALWKARVPEDGEVFWESPWGQGRPGWHIECSAMSMALLGPSFDLHLGGEDLAFPHHEDEIAQSEGAGLQQFGKPFVKHWVHGAHLLAEGKKMSKSLGNFFTVRDLLEKGFTGREIRCLLLSSHYRETFNFTLEGLAGARTKLARIQECLDKLYEFCDGTIGKLTGSPDAGTLNQFVNALDNDLNVSRSWAVIFEWIRNLNRLISQKKMSPTDAISALSTWFCMDEVLGLAMEPIRSLRMSQMPQIVPSGTVLRKEGELQVPADVQILFAQRMEARASRDFARADALRNELKAQGWLVEDTPKGPKLKRVN